MSVDKKNILYIVSEDASGMRPYAATILSAVMNENSWAVIVVRGEKSKESYKELSQKNIIYIDYPHRKVERLLWHFYPKRLINTIKALLKKHKIELVHTLTVEISLWLVFNRLFKNKNVLHTVHDAIAHDVKYKSFFEWLKAKVLVDIPNKIMIGKAKNVVTNSNPQAEYLRKIFPHKTVSYVPFPTLVNDAIKNGTKEVRELYGEKDYVLFFGSVNLYKGVHLLYQLYCKHKEAFGGRKLVIAGLGSDYFGIAKGDSDVIRVNRFIDDTEVKSLFENAAVVVYPYISATQSGVLSIASYFGKKMLLSNIPFFVSEIRNSHAVRIVDVAKEEDFIEGLNQLFKTEADSYDLYADIYDKKVLRDGLKNVQQRILTQ